MKILQVCLKPPYPKVDGGCMAEASITESLLKGGHKVKCFTMSTHKHPFSVARIPNLILKKTEMETVEINTRIKPMKAFLNLFGSESYNIARFYDDAFELRLLSIIKHGEFDAIILESLFCTPYLAAIKKTSNAKIIVRTHNVEFQIWEQLAFSDSSSIRKWYLNLLARRLKNYEPSALNKADGILAITEEDKIEFEKLGVNIPIQILPVGMNIKGIPINRKPLRKLNMYHVGSMDWQPNIEGVEWFIDDVWPEIKKRLPEIECHLAGRKMPKELMDKSGNGLTVYGEIESVKEFVKDKAIAIVPLLSGSGLRVKIVEAMALGKVVVTTSIGAMGIPYKNKKHLIIANTPADFAEQIEWLQENPKEAAKISKQARLLAETEFDIDNLSSKLTYFCKQLS